MFRFTTNQHSQRRGVILVLSVVLMVVFLGLLALAVDLGYIMMAKSELQAAADSAALAAAGSLGQNQTTSTQTAITFATQNHIGTKPVKITAADVAYGTWDTSTRKFVPDTSGLGNTVKVTAHADSTTSGAIPLFFAHIFNMRSINLQASAVATTNPRDICFVVDLSGSMNDDTDPNNTSGINTKYSGVGTTMMQNIYSDFGFGTYPGTSESVGQPLGVSSISALTNTSTSPLLNTKQPLKLKVNGTNYNYTVPAAYQVKSSDSSTTRTKKAYSWVMDVQLRGVTNFVPLPGVMKAAKPTPNSTDSNNYNYWYDYISNNSSTIGYSTYMQYMMYCGRDLKPTSSSNLYTPLSIKSADCPYHAESTDGGSFNFPPREMPTHASRRAIISALKIVKDRNQGITNTNQCDWVSIVTFDLTSNSVVLHSLSYDYDVAMQDCTKLQACSDSNYCTSTETGLITAINLLNTSGRTHTNKVVVLLTDGKPNLYSSTNNTITTYEGNHNNSNFYGGGSDYAQDAAMMQASIMLGTNWSFFPVQLGLQGDQDFMDRIYSITQGKTTQTLSSPYNATGNPTNYETDLKNIFNKIISNPKMRLVQ